MPAIRYHYQAVFAVADHMPSSKPVEARLRSGSFARLRWQGMICEAAAEMVPGLGFVKVRAHEVTDGDGIAICEWRRLSKGEYVMGWRCMISTGEEAVYGIVDKEGWPIVVGENGRKGVPRLKIAV